MTIPSDKTLRLERTKLNPQQPKGRNTTLIMALVAGVAAAALAYVFLSKQGTQTPPPAQVAPQPSSDRSPDQGFIQYASARRQERLQQQQEMVDLILNKYSRRNDRQHLLYVDPHGAFSIDQDEGPGFGLIAGGVGIAGLISMLRTMADRGDVRPVLLFYGNREWDDAAFRDDLALLAAQGRVHFHYDGGDLYPRPPAA